MARVGSRRPPFANCTRVRYTSHRPLIACVRPLSSAQFEAKFGTTWAAALESGKVFNAMDACTELGIDAMALDKLWGDAKKKDNLVKFGGGCILYIRYLCHTHHLIKFGGGGRPLHPSYPRPPF